MKGWLRNNGLTIALLVLFAASLAGQAVTGWASENQTLLDHGKAPLLITSYLLSAPFLSALFENWESEFLQMWVFVMLTAYLFQRGSPESKVPDETAPQDRDPKRDAHKASAPWPVRVGGWAAIAYSHSLGMVLLGLFMASFILHWINSARRAAGEAITHGHPPLSAVSYLSQPEFWFESFQNWQSEFLSTAVLIVLAIFLRERGSPESKPVGAPHSQTGTD